MNSVQALYCWTKLMHASSAPYSKGKATPFKNNNDQQSVWGLADFRSKLQTCHYLLEKRRLSRWSTWWEFLPPWQQITSLRVRGQRWLRGSRRILPYQRLSSQSVKEMLSSHANLRKKDSSLCTCIRNHTIMEAPSRLHVLSPSEVSNLWQVQNRITV